MNLFLDLLQETRIKAAQNDAQGARERASDAVAATGDLRQRVEMLALANQALFEILQERLGLQEDEVISRMAQVDARDGARDGRITPEIITCSKCARKVSTTRHQCMYCGTVILCGSPFQKAQRQ